MLVIRVAQMRALEEDQLCRWILDFLRSHYGDEFLTGESYWKETVASVDEARRRRLTTGFEIRKYVHVAFLTRWKLETAAEYAWAREILDDEERGEPGDRIARVESALAGRV